MIKRQFSDIKLTEKNEAGTIVKRAWSIGQLMIVVIDKALAEDMQIVDGAILEQVPVEDGILLKLRRQPN